MKAFIALLLVSVAAAQTFLDTDKDVLTSLLTHKGQFRGPFSSYLYGKMPLTDRMYADTFKYNMHTPSSIMNRMVIDPMMMDKTFDTTIMPYGRILTLEEMVRTPLFMEYYNIPLFRQFWNVPSFKIFLVTPQFQMYWTNPMFKVLFENPTYFYKYIYPMIQMNVHTSSIGTGMLNFPTYKWNTNMMDMDIPSIHRSTVSPLYNLWNVFGRTTDRESTIYNKFLLEKLLKAIKISKPDVTEVDVKVEKPEIVRVDEQTYGKFVNPITHQVKVSPVDTVKTLEEEVDAKKYIVDPVENTMERVDLPLPLLLKKFSTYNTLTKPINIGGRWIHPKMIPRILDEMRMNLKDIDTSDIDVDTLIELVKHRFGKLEDVEELRNMMLHKNIDLDMLPTMTRVEKLEMLKMIKNLIHRVPLTYGNTLINGGYPTTFNIPRDILKPTVVGVDV